MGIPKLLQDLAIISKLGDNPGSDNGLTTSAFRAKFDEAALKIQEYINNTIVPAIGVLASPEEGLKMKANIDMDGYRVVGLGNPTDAAHAATKEYVDGKDVLHVVDLPAAGWLDKFQTIAIDGITTNTPVIVAAEPDDDNLVSYCESNVRATKKGTNSLTFKCDEVPKIDLTVNVWIRT